MTNAAGYRTSEAAMVPETAHIAHDFNNLLGIVIGNLDLLAERCGDDPEAASLVNEALAAALRGTALARQLSAPNAG